MNFWPAQYLHPQPTLLSIRKARERILFPFPSNSNQVSEGISSIACLQRFNANHLPLSTPKTVIALKACPRMKMEQNAMD